MSGTYLKAICLPFSVVGGGFVVRVGFAWESVEKAVRAAHDPIKMNILICLRATVNRLFDAAL